MFAILSAHPDLADKRSGEYTEEWLHAGPQFPRHGRQRDALTAEKAGADTSSNGSQLMYAAINIAVAAYNAIAGERGLPRLLSLDRVIEQCGVSPETFARHCNSSGAERRTHS